MYSLSIVMVLHELVSKIVCVCTFLTSNGFNAIRTLSMYNVSIFMGLMLKGKIQSLVCGSTLLKGFQAFVCECPVFPL